MFTDQRQEGQSICHLPEWKVHIRGSWTKITHWLRKKKDNPWGAKTKLIDFIKANMSHRGEEKILLGWSTPKNSGPHFVPYSWDGFVTFAISHEQEQAPAQEAALHKGTISWFPDEQSS